MLIEISSYPKSGNTWLRYLIATFFDVNVHHGIPDIHQKINDTKESIEWIQFRRQTLGFYKSHLVDSRAMRPDRIFLIYRHPLDVFLSSLNYFFVRKKSERFIDGIPKSVDELFRSGELGKYFDAFLREPGESYYKLLLGRESNIFNYLTSALENSKVVSIRYEDLFDFPSQTLKRGLEALLDLGDVEVPDDVLLDADRATKGSGKPFYWKAKKHNYLDYLSEEQIAQFCSRYSNEMRLLGYS